MATRKTRKRKTMQRMGPMIKCPAPYEWLPDAMESYADDSGWTHANAVCHLLDTGLSRDLSQLRVLRVLPTGRGMNGDGRAMASFVKAYSISAEYLDLESRIAVALGELREQHVARARDALRELVKLGLVVGSGSVRGWRWRDGGRSGLLTQFTADGELPEELVREACDYITDDMTVADVHRAILAAELQAAKLAPDGWATRPVSVGIGTPLFKARRMTNFVQAPVEEKQGESEFGDVDDDEGDERD